MEFDIKQHWWILVLIAAALILVVSKSQLNFLGAALSPADQTLCTSSGGAIKGTPLYDTVPLVVGLNNILLKVNNESYKIADLLKNLPAASYDMVTSSGKIYVPAGTANTLTEVTSANWSISINMISAQSFVYNYSEPVCACAAGKSFASGVGCLLASSNQSLCLSTAGVWNETGVSITTGIAKEKCVCSANTKWKEGCIATVAKKAYCMDDLCLAEQTFNLLSAEALPSNCFQAPVCTATATTTCPTAKETCVAALECTINSDCSKEIDAPNDCSVFFSESKITQAGTCSAGVCVFPAATAATCTSSQLWWQDSIRWILAGALFAILIIYLIWERGPKRGLFKK